MKKHKIRIFVFWFLEVLVSPLLAMFFIFSLFRFAKGYTLNFDYPYLDYTYIAGIGSVFGMLYLLGAEALRSLFDWLKRKFCKFDS